ncbi:MAG: DUF1801 domain-containing protein [Bacteroidetes bacterium]|nr:DUF1801 domain-containing protein [Bacteroidota bacterium]
MNKHIKDIDTYLALQPEDVRIVLQRLRQIIIKIIPDAQEVISYNMPAFKYHGMLVGFAAFKNHCSFFPWNGSTVEQFKDDLVNFSTTKGTIRFTIGNPIPDELLTKMIIFRINQNLNKQKTLRSKPNII